MVLPGFNGISRVFLWFYLVSMGFLWFFCGFYLVLRTSVDVLSLGPY